MVHIQPLYYLDKTGQAYHVISRYGYSKLLEIAAPHETLEASDVGYEAHKSHAMKVRAVHFYNLVNDRGGKLLPF